MIYKAYLVGVIILIVAIVLNIFAKTAKLTSWYDFLNNRKLNNPLLDIIWLFFLYPFLLGLSAYLIYINLA